MVPVANGTPTDPYETIPTANAASGNSYEETPGAHETAPDPDESVESPRSASGSMSALAEFESVLADQYGLANLKVDWSLGSSLARELAQLVGVLVAPIQPLPAECPDRVVVRLQGRRDDRPVEVLVPGELRVSGLALRALRTLRAGSVLRADDAERVQDWVPPSARCESEIEGRFLTTAVASGRWISCSTLRQPPLVRRGEGLVVIYRGPGLELRGRGVARKDGWLGEHVAVRVGGAERDCHAQVVGPGAVQVEQADGEAVHR